MGFSTVGNPAIGPLSAEMQSEAVELLQLIISLTLLKIGSLLLAEGFTRKSMCEKCLRMPFFARGISATTDTLMLWVPGKLTTTQYIEVMGTL